MIRVLRALRSVPLIPLCSVAAMVAPVTASATATVTDDAVTLAAARPVAAATTSTTAPYLCFVTYPGGSTTVHYSLTFDATAPDTVSPRVPFTVTVTPPAITPNPALNVSVKQVRLALVPPATAKVLGVGLTGGSGLGAAGAQVERSGGAVVVKADGPFPAGTAFTLPTVTLRLMAPPSGELSVAHGGETLAAPSFSWVRTDPSDGTTQRPFACFTDQPVNLSRTVVTQ